MTTTQDSRTLLARAEAALAAVAPAPSSDVPQRIHPALALLPELIEAIRERDRMIVDLSTSATTLGQFAVDAMMRETASGAPKA